MKKLFLGTLLALGLMASAPAYALDLHEARAAGILGEKSDGYVTVLKKSAEADDLAKTVNSKRKQEYERISKENGQPASVVGALAAQQIANGLKPGSKYQDAAGSWKTR